MLAWARARQKGKQTVHSLWKSCETDSDVDEVPTLCPQARDTHARTMGTLWKQTRSNLHKISTGCGNRFGNLWTLSTVSTRLSQPIKIMRNPLLVPHGFHSQWKSCGTPGNQQRFPQGFPQAVEILWKPLLVYTQFSRYS